MASLFPLGVRRLVYAAGRQLGHADRGHGAYVLHTGRAHPAGGEGHSVVWAVLLRLRRLSADSARRPGAAGAALRSKGGEIRSRPVPNQSIHSAALVCSVDAGRGISVGSQHLATQAKGGSGVVPLQGLLLRLQLHDRDRRRVPVRHTQGGPQVPRSEREQGAGRLFALRRWC